MLSKITHVIPSKCYFISLLFQNNYPSVKNLLHKMKSLKSESEEYDESESESEHTISGQVESGFRSKQSFNRFHRNRLHSK